MLKIYVIVLIVEVYIVILRLWIKDDYLFGSNYYGECIAYNDETNIITPFRVDQIIKSKCNAKEIIEIELGKWNTKVMISV